MKLYGGRIRLYLTTALVVAGTILMGSLALQFISLLEIIDKQGKKEPVEVLFGWVTLQPQTLSPLMQMIILLTFAFFGFMMGVALSGPIYNQIVRTRNRIESMSAPEIWASVLGLIAGLLITVLIFSVVPVAMWLKVLVAFIVCYVCVIAFLSTKEQFNILFSGPTKEQKPADNKGAKPKLLDTNVIIDGRIADVCRAGFVEGAILIPKFVLEELQQIADSSDPLKRARGRRGLDILGQMQKEYPAQVKTMDTGNGNNGEEVDSRLVRLAQEINASVVTNDFNLNKVAGLQGVQVLNINELANALKPVVLPGEEMSVMIIKEGKEANQGIGYMDDGTMIVVEGGRRCIGDTLDVIVTSVLQTVAGKMIFANIKTEQVNEEDVLDRNIRSYSSSRQRKKIR